ncbi:MAG: transglutaminase [Deltaproteobacteria bacterium]|nr:MAG: transglutaminase [Deltaproteobacteria bacterium]
MMENLEKYLKPTSVIDWDNKKVTNFAKETAADTKDPIEMAVRIFYAVRDGIWYDPYTPFYKPEHYRASEILKRKRAFCIPKAVLLCALGRALGIPSRLCFFDVRNHLATKQLIEFLGGTDVFVFHGVTEFFLERKWIKATPAFNKELCELHKVPPVEFNGKKDAIFQTFNLRKRQFMEYLRYRGTYEDLPLEEILQAFQKRYGRERVRAWIDFFERSGRLSLREFAKEEMWKG